VPSPLAVNLQAAASGRNRFHRRPGEGRGPDAPALLRAFTPGCRLSPARCGWWVS